MNFFKHWKLEIFITVVSAILIPLLYLIFSPFYAPLVFIPMIYGLLPLLLIKRYKLLFCYPIGVSLVYGLFLLILSRSWPIDWSLFGMTFTTILIPTIVGYVIAFSSLKLMNPNHKWLIPIHLITAFLIVFLVIANYTASLTNPLWDKLTIYLFLPLVFLGSQALISYLYPSNRLSPLVNSLVFIVIHGFSKGDYLSPLSLLYLFLSYAVIFLLVTTIKKPQSL